MNHTIIRIIGYTILWCAVHYNRKGDSKIAFPSWGWAFVLLLLVIGVTLIQYVHH